MATETELETMATWLEGQRFTCPKRRAVTLSYLHLAFGTLTALQLREVCRYLVANRGKPIAWLTLRRKTEPQSRARSDHEPE